ncbi:unnamed protein product, partial [Leptidea sinapis]
RWQIGKSASYKYKALSSKQCLIYTLELYLWVVDKVKASQVHCKHNDICCGLAIKLPFNIFNSISLIWFPHSR